MSESGFYGGGSTSCSATMRVPSLTGDSGAVALWTGIGDSSDRLQQVGITATRTTGFTKYQGFGENYPNGARPFGKDIYPGDTMKFEVARDGSQFRLTLENITRKWTESILTDDVPDDDYYSFTAAEKYTDTLAKFSEVTFTGISPAITRSWNGTGMKLTKHSGSSFSVAP